MHGRANIRIIYFTMQEKYEIKLSKASIQSYSLVNTQ